MKMNLNISNEHLLATFALWIDKCGDTIQWVMRMLEPYVIIEVYSMMHDISVQCYELSKLLLQRESYKEEPHGLREAQDRVYLSRVNHRISRRFNRGGK